MNTINNSNNNDDFNRLFNKVWNNKYLRTLIFTHVKLYSLNFYPRIFNSVESLVQFKQRDYLNSVHLISIQPGTEVDNDSDSDSSSFDSDSSSEVYFTPISIKIQGFGDKSKNTFNSNIKTKPLSGKKLNQYNRKKKLTLELKKKEKQENQNNVFTKSVSFRRRSLSVDEPIQQPRLRPVNHLAARRSSLILVKRKEETEEPTVPRALNATRKYSSSFSDKSSLSATGSVTDGEDTSSSSSSSSSSGSDSEYSDESDYESDGDDNNKFLDTKILKEILPSNVKNVLIDFRNQHQHRSGELKIYKLQDIPKSVTKLCIGHAINFPIGNYFKNSNNNYENLKVLELGNIFNEQIEPNVLPVNLLELTIGNSYNKYLVPGSLPSKLIYLSIGTRFNCEIDIGVLPISLIELRCYGFNKSLKPAVLPPSLKILFLTRYNNYININVLPMSLETLVLGQSFCSTIEPRALPVNLSKLKILSGHWNQKFTSDLLPPSLTHLEMENYKRRPKHLPKGLKYLIMGGLDKSLGDNLISKFKKTFGSGSSNDNNKGGTNGWVPQHLETLIIKQHFAYPILAGNLPIGLTCLELSPFFNQTLKENVLPNTIKRLRFHSFSNGGQPIKRTMLPSQLEELIFTLTFNQPIESLPYHNFKTLKLGSHFNQHIARGVLPETIEHVELSCLSYDKEIYIPNPSTTTLKFSNISHRTFPYLPSFLDKNITEFDVGPKCVITKLSFPANCRTLVISNNVLRVSAPGTFPHSITSLIFKCEIWIGSPFSKGCLKELPNLLNLELPFGFNKALKESELPSTIKSLTVGKKFTKEIKPIAFPSLEKLTITGFARPRINDPREFNNLKSIHVDHSNTNFLDSIDQLKFLNYIVLYKKIKQTISI